MVLFSYSYYGMNHVCILLYISLILLLQNLKKKIKEYTLFRCFLNIYNIFKYKLDKII